MLGSMAVLGSPGWVSSRRLLALVRVAIACCASLDRYQLTKTFAALGCGALLYQAIWVFPPAPPGAFDLNIELVGIGLMFWPMPAASACKMKSLTMPRATPTRHEISQSVIWRWSLE